MTDAYREQVVNAMAGIVHDGVDGSGSKWYWKQVMSVALDAALGVSTPCPTCYGYGGVGHDAEGVPNPTPCPTCEGSGVAGSALVRYLEARGDIPRYEAVNAWFDPETIDVILQAPEADDWTSSFTERLFVRVPTEPEEKP